MPDLFEQRGVLEMIIAYLEYEDIVCLRRTNKRLSELIEEPEIPENDSKPDFINLLSQDPMLDEYSNSEIVFRMWSNTVYGGSVLGSIKRAKTGIGSGIDMKAVTRKSMKKELNKTNSLKKKIG